MALSKNATGELVRRRAMRADVRKEIDARAFIRPLLPKIEAWQLRAARVRIDRDRADRGLGIFDNAKADRLANEVSSQIRELDQACARLPGQAAAGSAIANSRKALNAILMGLSPGV